MSLTKEFIKKEAQRIFADKQNPDHAVDAARYIAEKAFSGDKDKGGQPYFGHLERVADGVDTPYKTIAFLHDLMEDKLDWNADDLRDIGFSEWVIEGIDAVTKRDGEKYLDFIVRTAQTPQAIQVKMSDLKDNSNLLRLPHLPTDEDIDRVRKYYLANQYLNDVRMGKIPGSTSIINWMLRRETTPEEWIVVKNHCDHSDPHDRSPKLKP